MRRQRFAWHPAAFWLCAGLTLAVAQPAAAQLDPLLFLKRTRPNVILLVDTSHRMLFDADGGYYDPLDYSGPNSNAVRASLGLVGNEGHRRKYNDFVRQVEMTDLYATSSITAAGASSNASAYAAFRRRARIEVAKEAIKQVIQENSASVRFGLVKMRQNTPQVPTGTSLSMTAANDDPDQQNSDTNIAGRWFVRVPTVASANHAQPAPTSPNFALVRADATTANTDIVTVLNRSFTASGALLPAGADSDTVVDAPVANMLSDARSEAARLITADINTDKQCRNTVAVLIVGGGEGSGYTPASSASAVASQFLNISDRRVPIYVVAIAPAASSVAELMAIAANSGGQYFEITRDQIETAVSACREVVPEAVRAINVAVQHAFVRFSDMNTGPTSSLPYGPFSEFQTASPIVGTVDLGGLVPKSEWEDVETAAGVRVPQRSNLLVTAGFTLPGFEGRLRGFRVYKPVKDASKPSGYRFDADGQLLWTASLPSASERNIFTALPNGTVIPFSSVNAATLSPYLNTFDTEGLISFVRNQPLGAIVSSTPAVVDPPSLDPAPDTDYIDFIEEHEDRRTVIVIGTNNGMMHVIDARTGLEIWAYIPFNLLPKLRTLRDGQPIDSFAYFMDGSPKVADVKVKDANGKLVWRTYLVMGQGPGGTFYQAFDITMDGVANCIDKDDDTTSKLLSCFSSASRIPLKWSFPDYSRFDPIGHPAMPFGDLSAAATAAEKSVGQTWSDPAVGQIVNAEGPYVVLTGSGFFPFSAEQSAARGGARAGRAFYVLDVATGAPNGVPLAWRDVGSDGKGENIDNCQTAGNCEQIKNALQADPVATGASDSRFITKVYIGDLDGTVWRFNVGLSGSTPTLSAPTNLYSAGAPHPLFSSMAAVTVGTKQYLFFGTGSDLLPSAGVREAYRLIGILEGTSKPQFSLALARTDDSKGVEEKVTSFPAVAGEIVFFTTTVWESKLPCVLASANLYALTFIGGAAYASSNDTNDTFDKNESPIVRTIANQGRATAPFIVDQHLWFGIGEKVEMFGDPQDFNNGVGQVGVRILSWRQLR